MKEFVKESLLLASGVFFCSAIIFFLIGGKSAEAQVLLYQNYDPSEITEWTTSMNYSNLSSGCTGGSCDGTVTHMVFSLACETGDDCLSSSQEWGAVLYKGSPTTMSCVSEVKTAAEWGVGEDGAGNFVVFPVTGDCDITSGDFTSSNGTGWFLDGGTTSNIRTATGVNRSYSAPNGNLTYRAFYEGNPGGIPNPYTGTFIEIKSPTSTTATRTFDIEFDYQLLSDYPSAGDFSHVLFQLCARGYSQDPCLKFSSEISSLDSLNFDTLEVMAERDGYHLLLANFWNGVEETTDCPWWNLFCEETAPLLGPGDSVNFNVATTTIAADVPAWIEDMDICGGFDGIVDSALCNGLAFLFIPSDGALDRIFTLDEVLSQKQPFGFFFLVQQKMTEVGDTEASAGSGLTVDLGAGSLGSVNFFNFASAKSEMTDMGMDVTAITDLFNWMLWLMLGWYVWYRTMSVTSAPPKQLNLIGQET